MSTKSITTSQLLDWSCLLYSSCFLLRSSISECLITLLPVQPEMTRNSKDATRICFLFATINCLQAALSCHWWTNRRSGRSHNPAELKTAVVVVLLGGVAPASSHECLLSDYIYILQLNRWVLDMSQRTGSRNSFILMIPASLSCLGLKTTVLRLDR